MRNFILAFHLIMASLVYCDAAPISNEGRLIAQEEIDDQTYEGLPQTNFKKTLIKMLVSLVAVIALIIVSYIFFKKLVKNRITTSNHRSIQIIEKRPLSPKSMLYLLMVDGKKVLLTESHLQIKQLPLYEDDLEEETNQ